MMKRRVGLGVLMAGLVAIAFVTGAWLERPQPAAHGTVYQQARLFEAVLGAIRAHYVDSISETDLYYRATTGIVDHLRDPYSALLVNDAYRRFQQDIAGTHDGLGLQVDLRAGAVVIAAVAPGSPGERDGLLPGDRIVSIDGQPTKGWNVEEASSALRGDPGTEVTLVVRRLGESDSSTHRLFRRAVHLPAASHGVLLPDSVGVVRVDVITSTSAAELEASVDSLRQRGMRSLVLDLRYCPGGILNQGIAIADLFLDPGQLIGTLRGRTPEETTEFRAKSDQAWPGLPVALLVNGGTASSAEIIATALQDHDRAVVVGTSTYGKAAVQSTLALSDSIAIRLTTARWYGPSGRTIQRPGLIPPDPAAPPVPADSAAPLEFYTDAGRAVPSNRGVVPDVIVGPVERTPAEQAFRRAVGEALPHYYDLLAAFAQEQRVAGVIRDTTVIITPRLRHDFIERLKNEQVPIPPELLPAIQPMIDRDLREAIAGEVFGAAAADRLRLAADPQLQRAIGALAEVPGVEAALAAH